MFGTLFLLPSEMDYLSATWVFSGLGRHQKRPLCPDLSFGAFHAADLSQKQRTGILRLTFWKTFALLWQGNCFNQLDL